MRTQDQLSCILSLSAWYVQQAVLECTCHIDKYSICASHLQRTCLGRRLRFSLHFFRLPVHNWPGYWSRQLVRLEDAGESQGSQEAEKHKGVPVLYPQCGFSLHTDRIIVTPSSGCLPLPRLSPSHPTPPHPTERPNAILSPSKAWPSSIEAPSSV